MRIFNGTALNILYAERKGKIQPLGELIIVSSDVVYTTNAVVGALNKSLESSTLRLSVDAPSLREIAHALKDYADDLDKAGKALPKERQEAKE